MEMSEDLPADAVARERASFVSRCTDRLALAANALRTRRDKASARTSGGGNGSYAGDREVPSFGGEGFEEVQVCSLAH